MNIYINTGMIREIRDLKIKNAMKYIEKYQGMTTRRAVTVFRNTLSSDQANIDLNKYVNNEKRLIIRKESFQIIKDGVLKPIDLSKKKQQSEYKRLLIESENKVIIEDIEGVADEEKAFTAFKTLCSMVNDPVFYYGRDCIVSPNNIMYLQSQVSTLHPKNKKDKFEGINTSMFYIGGPGSFTSCHCEDGDFPSLNLLLYGKQKFWYFIDKAYIDKIKTKISEYMNIPGCHIFHKPGFLLNPVLLQQWGIPVQFLVQNPGDLVYVGEGITHAVINNGINIAEAINFGTKDIFTKPSITFCACKNIGRQRRSVFLTKNTEASKLRSSTKNTYNCNVENCNLIFYEKKSYDRHLVTDHNESPFQCKNKSCNFRFKNRWQLKRHNDKYHKDVIKEICVIDNCGRLISKSSMHKHIKEIHSKEARERITCVKCKKKIFKYMLRVHSKRCTGTIICDTCKRVFKSTQGRSQHKCC